MYRYDLSARILYALHHQTLEIAIATIIVALPLSILIASILP